MVTMVRDSKQAQALSSFVILDKKGKHVATVQAHYRESLVKVDVWQESIAIDNCCMREHLWAKLPKDVDYKNSAWDMWHFQQGRASGYGYDKFTAALAGLIIDGHTMADHCGQVLEAEKARASLLKRYWSAMHSSQKHILPEHYKSALQTQKEWDAKAARLGCRFANWRSETNSYGSLHFASGLDRLEMLGYRVIRAL